MTMNKLEECARALAGTFWDDQPHDYMPDDAKKRAKQREYFVTDNWSQWLPDARAVIRCLMEPSEGMLNAPSFSLETTHLKMYRAMLQSVLNEGKE